jgi:hypothetical protein
MQEMQITVPGNTSNHGHITVSARCPHCWKEAVLEPLGKHDFTVAPEIVCGQRRCPNPEYWGHMFVAFQKGKLAISYPPVRIDFNPENIFRLGFLPEVYNLIPDRWGNGVKKVSQGNF